MPDLKVAIVGCGKIADQHLLAIRRLGGARVVGVCDRESLLAEQLGERYEVDYRTDDVSRLLYDLKPDIVHITAPPQSHYDLALKCLEAGSHVYVEKPFTVNTDEAVSLLNFAEKHALKVTVGHNLQFAPENMEARALIRRGFLGGSPVYIESYYTYNFLNDSYAIALLGDDAHWVRCLPGQLLHNIISHAVARIAEFLEDTDPQLSIIAYTSPALKRMGEKRLIDELRVHIFDRNNMTGLLVFSSQLSPPVNRFRIYGPKNSLEIDNHHRTLVRLENKSYKSYLNYFMYPMVMAKEHLRCSINNISKFMRCEFHDDSGMTSLIQNFYASVRNKGPLPIRYKEIISTCRIMDRIFEYMANEKMSV
jgi:predicted dehydrogenase